MRFPNTINIRTAVGYIAIFLAQQFVFAEPGDINTIIGNGAYGVPTFGVAATATSLNYPKFLAVDPRGNLYFSDAGKQIAYVDKATRTITHFAGQSGSAVPGDEGPATEAGFELTDGVALDRQGNLFIVDLLDYKIRRVDALTGIITTVAGTGVSGYSGDGGPATEARLSRPSSITIDRNGNIYFSDTERTRIRRIDADTGHISTVAGAGFNGFSGDGSPAYYSVLDNVRGMTTDLSGNLFIADSGNNRIRKIDISTGIIDTVAGSAAGPVTENVDALSATFRSPFDVCFDGAGNLFVSDHSNRCVRRIDVVTNLVTTVAGTGTSGFSGEGGPATLAMMRNPFDIEMDHLGNLYIADYTNQRIRMVENAGAPVASPVVGQPIPNSVDRSILLRKMKKLKKQLTRAKRAGRISTVRKIRKQIKKLKKQM